MSNYITVDVDTSVDIYIGDYLDEIVEFLNNNKKQREEVLDKLYDDLDMYVPELSRERVTDNIKALKRKDPAIYEILKQEVEEIFNDD